MDELLSIGSDSVERFLRRWYGDAMGGAVSDKNVGPDIPSELVEWHAAAESAGARVTYQDHPIALDDLSRDPDGMLPFWVENQHGCSWGVNPDHCDRQVFYRWSGSTKWERTGEGLRDFLLHCSVREAVIGADEKFTTFVAERNLSEALACFSPLSFVPLASEEPETRLWCSADALARLAVPPVGYEGSATSGPERLWMLTVAVAKGAHIDAYASRFGVDVSGEMEPSVPDAADEFPPF